MRAPMDGPTDSSRQQRKNRRHVRLIASQAVRRWRCRSRATRLYDVGRTIELTARGPSATSRSARIYRRGLRVLQTEFSVDVPSNGLSARDQMEWVLAVSAPWTRLWSWLRRRRMVAVATIVAALIVMASVIAVAISRVSPTNRAANRPWRASSSGAGFPIEGYLSDAPAPIAFMHTGGEERPSVTVDLGRRQIISRVEVSNRVDCCIERAVPLVIEGSIDGQHWTFMARRSNVFSVWRVRVFPQSVRFVRLRIDRPGILNLRGIRVF